jgi:uncharacterized glyoxalase superfamily protein PhnB
MNGPSALKAVFPLFVVPDVVKTAEYYRDILGFTIQGYFLDPPVYAMLRRGDVEIHFGKSDTGETHSNQSLRKGLGADAYFVVSDIEAFHKELTESGANIVEGTTKRIYGSTEFEVIDCDGHKLVFGD